MKDFGNLDGVLDDDFLNIGGEEVVGMTVTNSTNNVYPDMNEDLSAFDDYYYDASGKKKKRQDARAKKKETRTRRKEARVAGKEAENAEKLARAEMNKNLGTEKESDVELAKALSESVKDDSSKKAPMSTTTKIIIGVGAALLIGGIAYFILRKRK